MAKICIATGTRADWGILTPLADALRRSPGIELQILATNMHLLDCYGHTADEIEAAGFPIDARVTMPVHPEGGALSRATAMGTCLAGCAEAFSKLLPDAVIVLGDRFEMLAVASAAVVMNIPIIHISGGEITGGAIDDSIRHAITKLATLHLVSAEPYRRRVIQMGEKPENVINTGSLGVWNMLHRPCMSREELAREIGFDAAKPFVVATFHPATLDSVSPSERVREMLSALDRHRGLQVILTYPNNDTGSGEIIHEIGQWAERNSDRVFLIKSLGLRRYLSAIREAEFVIGNSSSGIIEVPAVGTPVINIGIRQQGRLHGPGVIDCGDDCESIAEAIEKALSREFREVARKGENPYFSPDTLDKSVIAIQNFAARLPVGPKQFHDIDFETD